MFIVSVIVLSNCHILQVLQSSNVQCARLIAAGRRTQAATPLTNGAINENQLSFDEGKAYKNYAKFLGHILHDVTVTLDNN